MACMISRVLTLILMTSSILCDPYSVSGIESEDGAFDSASRSGRAALRSDSTHPHPMLLTGEDDAEDRAFQRCLTPNKEEGHCRHVRYCVLNEFQDNFDRFKDYACVIEGKYIGVCCPDDGRDLYDKSRDIPARSLGNRTTRPWQSGAEPGARPSRGRRRRPRPVNDKQLTTQNRARLDDLSCGVSKAMQRNENAKVEGGQQSEVGEYPWMVALLREGQQQFCGGVLLDANHVLTAAHCVYNIDAADLTVGLGEYDLSQPNPDRVQTFGVSDILVNERFNSDAYTDDIAILYMDGEAEYTDYVWPICLPPPNINLTDEIAVVIGWGTVYYGGPPSNVLMQVTLPIWSQENCQRQFDQPILDTEICAGTEAGGKDSCQGDSGGPLLLQMSDGRWCNIGVVSFGVRCGEPGKPGVYTNVGKYLDWIAQNTRT